MKKWKFIYIQFIIMIKIVNRTHGKIVRQKNLVNTDAI
jgi:hypothetical protein